MDSNMFFSYIDNIEYDVVPNKKIKYICIRNNKDTLNTFRLFQILLLFSIFKTKTQFRNFITFRLVKFFNQYFKKKWKNYTDIGIRIFFNLVKHRDLYNWENYCNNLYVIFENINHIYCKQYNLITFSYEQVLKNSYDFVHSVIMLNYLIYHLKIDNTLSFLEKIYLHEYLYFESNVIVSRLLL